MRPSKKVSDSQTMQQYLIRPAHINPYGRLFGAQLLKWIDEVAGIVAVRHANAIVTTAAIDNLQFTKPAYAGQMIVLLGQVTYVGRTSMEVRVDADRVYERDGSSWYYSHKATYPCDGADYSAVMYSVSMGQKNESDRITAAQALAGSERTMSGVVGLSGKKLYAEQLLYMDSTEEFSYNTQVLDEEVDDYVRQLAPVLQKNTMGYGLWVYRNYVNNCVYNGQFGLGTTGWKFTGGSSVETIDGTPMAHIGNGKKIFQEINNRLSARDEITVEFYAKPKGNKTDVKVKLGAEEKTVKVTEAGTYSVVFPWIHSYNLELESNKDIYLDDIRVYTYELFGRIYVTDGTEQDLADDFRILNSQLP